MYLGSTSSDNISFDAEINKCIGKVATIPRYLSICVWKKSKLSTTTKMAVYTKPASLSFSSMALKHGQCKSGAEAEQLPYALPSMHPRHTVEWERLPNAQVLDHTGMPTKFTLLRQCRLHWLGHMRWMENGRIPKVIFYGELTSGNRSLSCLQLLFKGSWMHDMNALNIKTENWEDTAEDRCRWLCILCE